MKPRQTYLILLHLRNGQSIGPERLGSMWKTACGGSPGSSVTCRCRGEEFDQSVTYQLRAMSDTPIKAAEELMRDMLDSDGFVFRLTRSR